jgi:DNA-binding GntR family transcriptional regulator
MTTDGGRGTSLQLAVSELRAAIMSGELKPGERIQQAAIAEQYGMSRQPIREALRELQAEGLVTVTPNAGARVVRLTLDDLRELYWLRLAIEPSAIALSAPRLGDDALGMLRAAVAEMEDLARVGTAAQRWLAADERFHATALSEVGMPRVREEIQALWTRAAAYRSALGEALYPDRLELVHYEHRLLLDALERRDGRDAEAVLGVHLRRTLSYVTSHPELLPA